MGKTFQEILDSMLMEVSDSVDKREGSLIWSALAPMAAQLAEGYAYFDDYVDLLMADTASGEYLDRLCGLVGIERNPATAAVIIGEFRDGTGSLVDVEIGSEFSAGTVVFAVTSQISNGKFLLTAETLGTEGNLAQGSLLPVDYTADLFSAEIVGISEYAEDVESDEHLRLRYISNMTVPAFGGNVADYEQKVLTFEGIGAVKVFPICRGAGTVGIVVGSESNKSVDNDLVNEISEAFNKKDTQNLSCGLAPIGHEVIVKSAIDLPINIDAVIVTEDGVVLDNITSEITESVKEYIDGISFDQSMVHTAPIEMAILSVSGVADIKSLTINSQAETYVLNKTFDTYQVPVFNTLNLEV
jgi:uncharacterized phage protein gp47/JayE